VVTASVFKDDAFGQRYGVTMTDGKLAGLLARAVVVVDTDGTVLHSQLVPEVAQEPDYDAAISALG
jgi:thiol peroxidase